MCDIFPSFENCCGFIDLKIGIMMIAMLAIITGGIMMTEAEKYTKTSLQDVMGITNITSTEGALSNISMLVRSGLTAMAILFMLAGLILLLAVLGSQEGFIQLFVWVTFANVVFGLLMVIAIAYECTAKKVCLLSTLDWLTGASSLVLAVFYLLSWIYFISVANSLVVLTFG